MNLTIDIGNTLVKMAVFQRDKMVGFSSTKSEYFIEEFQKYLTKFPKIDHTIVASVQKMKPTWINFLQQQSNVLMLSSSTKLPFKNKYESPKTLGVDRIALAAAAWHRYPQKNVLVIDAGTCITYDFVNDDGVYLGGAISPGIAMRFTAMHTFTGKLPLLPVQHLMLESVIGKDTQQSMQIGVLKGTVYEIDGFITEYSKKYKDLTVILTGGDSEILSKSVKNSIFAPSNFLLTGLNTILEANKTR